LRASADDAALVAAIGEAIGRKPHGHEFVIARGAAPAVERVMSVTGG
jgi:cyclic pyranopterin phosphate synthase